MDFFWLEMTKESGKRLEDIVLEILMKILSNCLFWGDKMFHVLAELVLCDLNV